MNSQLIISDHLRFPWPITIRNSKGKSWKKLTSFLSSSRSKSNARRGTKRSLASTSTPLILCLSTWHWEKSKRCGLTFAWQISSNSSTNNLPSPTRLRSANQAQTRDSGIFMTVACARANQHWSSKNLWLRSQLVIKLAWTMIACMHFGFKLALKMQLWWGHLWECWTKQSRVWWTMIWSIHRLIRGISHPIFLSLWPPKRSWISAWFDKHPALTL